MAKMKTDKRKAKRKAKLVKRRKKSILTNQKEKAQFFYFEAGWFFDQREYAKALTNIKRALRLDPENEEMIRFMGNIGNRMKRTDIELQALQNLYELGLLDIQNREVFCRFLQFHDRYEEAMDVAEETLAMLPEMKIPQKQRLASSLTTSKNQSEMMLQLQNSGGKRFAKGSIQGAGAKKKDASSDKPPEPQKEKEPVQAKQTQPSFTDIPVSVHLDQKRFQDFFKQKTLSAKDVYDLTINGYQIRFKESYDNLICLSQLAGVRSLWYQEETARKVLKSLRGRALLSDEVGLGKTIEAAMVLKEYIQRGMVKSGLILTPAALVSQWKEELKFKFDLDFPSTDDPDFRSKGKSFWKAPFLLASISLAKSSTHFETVTAREYDMVIVDEAHHLKNRTTLNWKLVNTLKKRFLLLLTATPVENNLMELYNLITLLKPGQLKTASIFRQEFMTRGDPTDPRNRRQLKELLGQVMIRNTRALAKIDIPSRFAQTIRVDVSQSEKVLYERISQFVVLMARNKTNGPKTPRLLLKTLLAEAGSSPRAVSLTLSRIRADREMPFEQEKEIEAILNWCRSMGDTQKNKVLFKLIKNHPGKKIIFVKYLGTIDYLSEFLAWQTIPHVLFHGGMNNQKKDAAIEAFKNDKDIMVSTQIGGEGRNLQFCNQMINYDLPWNPMKIEQRIGRIHRIGQEKEVFIYNLCAAGSIEDYILEVLDKKINMFEMVIGEIDMIMGRIRGEQDFSEMVFDIWVNADSEKEKEKSFNKLAADLKRSKTRYHKTKELDEKLFGDSYEL